MDVPQLLMYVNGLTIMGRAGTKVGRQAQVMAIPPCNVDQKYNSEKVTGCSGQLL